VFTFPVDLNGVCPTNKTELHSLYFSITRVLMKMFHTYSIDIIEECQGFFGFSSFEILVKHIVTTFLHKYCVLNNVLCSVIDAQ
jgi:hypothetical protein